jgi:hypothetical protein
MRPMVATIGAVAAQVQHFAQRFLGNQQAIETAYAVIAPVF